MTEENMIKAEENGLLKSFKLISTLTTNNMVLFNSEGKIKKYLDVNEIMDEFYIIRLNAYQKRKVMFSLV